MEEFDEEIEKDPFIRQVKLDISEGDKPHVGYTLEKGRLLYKGMLVIPKKLEINTQSFERISRLSYRRACR